MSKLCALLALPLFTLACGTQGSIGNDDADSELDSIMNDVASFLEGDTAPGEERPCNGDGEHADRPDDAPEPPTREERCERVGEMCVSIDERCADVADVPVPETPEDSACAALHTGDRDHGDTPPERPDNPPTDAPDPTDTPDRPDTPTTDERPDSGETRPSPPSSEEIAACQAERCARMSARCDRAAEICAAAP